jgi:hypothetical protein
VVFGHVNCKECSSSELVVVAAAATATATATAAAVAAAMQSATIITTLVLLCSTNQGIRFSHSKSSK